jgi:hypothetical protein
MAKKGESNFRVKVKKDLATLFPLVKVFPISQTSIVGTPDFLICMGGIFGALEIKDESGETSSIQDHELTGTAHAGGYAWCARPSTWDEVFAHIEVIAKGNHTQRWVYDPGTGRAPTKSRRKV